mgnify:FL=1
MNIKKNIDYGTMFSALDVLMATDLPQMELYYEIGRVVSDNQEKGATIAAAEYLQSAYSDMIGFSPRNLRRMREFYCAYASAPEIMAEAMSLGWTQNLVILEAGLTIRERLWYIRAARRLGWSKSVLVQQITAATHMSLDLAEEMCYTGGNDSAGEVPGYAETASSQCHGTGSSGTADGLPAILFLFNPNFFYRGIHAGPLLVCRRRGRSVGMEDGTTPPDPIERKRRMCMENQRTQSHSDVKLGKFLSLVLRHNPDAAGISLDEHGWADVQELLAGVRRSGRQINMETLERIVRENNKQRYSFNTDHTKIRANQGHSLQVDVELTAVQPPRYLYHGTAARFLPAIQQEGIKKMSRQYVHLSGDFQTALVVGRRHGSPVVITINAEAMAHDGVAFYLSENGVWLCEYVAPVYFSTKG